MNVGELVARLAAYPECLRVMVFEDWGSGYVITPVSNVIERSEFEELDEEDQVIICFEREDI